MRILVCTAALAATLVCAPSWATVDNFLLVDGINGESTDAQHPKWIDVDNWSWGLSNAGKPAFQDFSWVQQVDSSVVPLFLGVASGKHFKDATLDVTKTSKDSDSFFQMIFKDVTLTSLNVSGNDVVPQASGSLAYQAVQMRYRPQKPDGTYGPWIEGEFSLKENKVLFSGNPQVVQGLFTSGGNVSLVALPVPEPASALLMIAGLAAAGAVVRRRRGG